MKTLRAWLFVPGDRPDWFARAAATGADALIVDLEDAVPPERKGEAREHVVAWLSGGGHAWVRVNGAATAEHGDDLAALERLRPGIVAGVVVPMVENASDVSAVADRLGVPVMALVETAFGVENSDAIARAKGSRALALGVADLGLDVGLGDDPLAWAYARSRLVFASRRAGLTAPLDGPTMALDEPDMVRTEADAARRFGFGGKLCIHPSQVAPVRAAFRPTLEEIAWARRVVAAKPDGGAVRVDGQMVDRPRVELARRLLAEFEG